MEGIPRQAKISQEQGDHWKLYIWSNYIEIRGNDKPYYVEPDKIGNIKVQ